MTEPIWSTGGAGGEHAVTQDLEYAVRVLRTAASRVADADHVLACRRAALQLDPSAGHAALIAELGYAAYVRGPALEDAVADAATRVAAVARAYLHAEEAARQKLSWQEMLAEDAADLTSLGTTAMRLTLAGALASKPLVWAFDAATDRNLPVDVLPHEAPSTTALLDRRVAEIASRSPGLIALEAALTLVAWIVENVVAEPWQGRLTAEQHRSAGSTSLEDIMDNLLAAETTNDGGVFIERWTGSDGVVRRIVYIPGTEDWTVWRDNPSDAEADGELRFGMLPDAARVVQAALTADGAQPGDPVLLTGHSLGGTVATALAANSEFLRRFNVTGVVTAGSPVGTITLPARVNALHLEGTRDIVPGLDGTPNPDTPTRTTVHHDARRSEAPQLKGAGKTIGSAHHLDTYAQTARLVDEGLSDSTDAWLRSQAAFLDTAKDPVLTKYTP